MQQLSCTPTLILHNARIYTQDAAQPWAQAVAVGDGRILAVGADAEVLALAGAGTERIDLGGQLVLPGLCDAHIHLSHHDLLKSINVVPFAARIENGENIGKHLDELVTLWNEQHPEAPVAL